MRKIQVAVVVALVVFAGATTQSQAISLWASDSDAGSFSTLFELNPATGAVLSSIPGPGTFADALSFTTDGQNIWVLDSSPSPGNPAGPSNVFRIDLTGAVQQSFQVALDAEGLTVLADGTLLIGGGNSGVIATVNPTTGAVVSSFPVQTSVNGMASNGVDRIFGLTISGVIDTYDLAGNLLSSLATGAAGNTLGLAFTGNSFFIASTGSTIYEVDLTGAVINSYSGPGPFTEGLDFPEGIQVNPIPEPMTVTLCMVGLAALGVSRRRRRAA
jgi:sugar lactone lactonase YvrE